MIRSARPSPVKERCWNKCGLEASLWMYKHDKTEEEAEEYFYRCLCRCEKGSSTS